MKANQNISLIIYISWIYEYIFTPKMELECNIFFILFWWDMICPNFEEWMTDIKPKKWVTFSETSQNRFLSPQSQTNNTTKLSTLKRRVSFTFLIHFYTPPCTHAIPQLLPARLCLIFHIHEDNLAKLDWKVHRRESYPCSAGDLLHPIPPVPSNPESPFAARRECTAEINKCNATI